MLTFHGTDAVQALAAFATHHADTLAELPRAKLIDALGSGSLFNIINDGLEALYASRAGLGPEGIELLNGLGRMFAQYGFAGKSLRGAAIAGVAQRIAAGGAAEAEGDPDIEEGFAPVAPDEAASLLALPGAPVPEGAGE